MDTLSRNNSFMKNLLISIGGIFIVFALCFGIYQHKREKEYKIDILHSRLQMFNYEMMQTLGRDSVVSHQTFYQYVQRQNIEGLRVSIINTDGTVLLDSYEPQTAAFENHLQRKEIKQAMAKGNGYDIKRASQSSPQTYFYSATLFDDIIIRTAVPYSSELSRMLKADNTYLYFTFLLTILLGVVLYYNTKRIARHIGYLHEFAVKAEEGQELDHELERKLPDDELGDISHTIIMLYWKLRHSEEDKIRLKRQLTQNAAHELKTPAASIHGYLESILENPDMPPEKRQHFIERCYAQSERMNKLLLDMAVLTKLDEAENTEEWNQQTDLAEIIRTVLDDTALQISQKGIDVQTSLPDNLFIIGNKSMLYSIFRNLVDNVIAYAYNANTLKIGCTEKHEHDCKYYEFTVADNGNGVEPEHLSHLFERFYRIDKGRSRKLGGTGLGLAIVKNAVAAHHGNVAAEITPGGGLTIRFTLKAE